MLPLRPGARVAVLGRLADTVNLGDGGSSDVWDLDCVTVLGGLRDAVDVVHDDGADPQRAAAVAADADVALVVVGYTYLDEGEYIGSTDPSLRDLFPAADEPGEVERFEATTVDLTPTVKPARLGERPSGFSAGGDRASLRLTEGDVALIRVVAAANPRTVVAIQAGSAVIVDEWIDAVPAIVQSWYGGCQAGPGLADVLVGNVDPSARLPFSVPTTEEHLPHVRPRGHLVPLRPLARLVAPGAQRHRPAVPVRLRPRLHHVRVAQQRDGLRRLVAHRARHRGEHRRARWRRRRPGLRHAPPTPTRRRASSGSSASRSAPAPPPT